MKTHKKITAFILAGVWAVTLLGSPGKVSADSLTGIPAQTSGEESTREQNSDTTGTRLEIDNENLYEGMDRSYSQGYVPRVEQGNVLLIVPLLSSGDLKDNRLRAALNLGDVQTMPFVNKNYNKTISLQSLPVNNGAGTVEGYLVVFSLELKPDRYNGSYPVVLSIGTVDGKGREVQQDFTVYVNITDGRNPDGEPAAEAQTEEPVTYAPKVMVEACEFSGEVIQAGDRIKAEITLVNTSQTESIRNMTVTVEAQESYFLLLSDSDSIYVESVPAGGTTRIPIEYEISGATPGGQYNLAVSMNYADAKGNTYSENGRVKVNVVQPMRIQFDSLSIPASMQVADIVEAQIQALNLGKSKAYNVRAEIEADGLLPEGSIFIGDVEPGSAATGTTLVSVTSLSEGTALYGNTKGTVRFWYEDENGTEYEETQEFSVSIESPFSNRQQEEEDQTGQWWIIMAVIAGIICIFIGYIILRRMRKQKHREVRREDELVE